MVDGLPVLPLAVLNVELDGLVGSGSDGAVEVPVGSERGSPELLADFVPALHPHPPRAGPLQETRQLRYAVVLACAHEEVSVFWAELHSVESETVPGGGVAERLLTDPFHLTVMEDVTPVLGCEL